MENREIPNIKVSGHSYASGYRKGTWETLKTAYPLWAPDDKVFKSMFGARGVVRWRS